MLQALLVSLAYWALLLTHRFGANSMAERPIVVGPVVGILLGEPVLGTLIGAQLEVIYLGVVSVGGAQATDTLYATAMAVALAVLTKMPTEAAIALSIPLGFLGLFILQVTRIFFAFMCPILDRIAEKGNAKSYSFAYIMHIVVGYSFGPITMFLALSAGADATQLFIANLPPYIMNGMKVVGGILPALGLGVLLSMIWDFKKSIYFFLGFILVVYLKIPIIGLAVIGVFLMLTDLYKNQKFIEVKKLVASGAKVKNEEEVFFSE